MRRWFVLSLILLLEVWTPVQAGRTFTDGTFLSVEPAVVTAVPLTLCVWVNPTAIGNFMDIMAITRTSGDNNRHGIQMSTTGQAQAASVEAVTAGVATLTSPTIAAGAWSLVCGVFRSTTSRTVFLNGAANQASNTTAIAPSSGQRSYVGRGRASTTNNEFNGILGVAMFWDTDLADVEITALAGGAHPRTVRPLNLVSCPHIYGDLSPEMDECGARSWTVTGSPAKATTRPPVGVFSLGLRR